MSYILRSISWKIPGFFSLLIQRLRRSRSVMNWHNTRVIMSTCSLNCFLLMRPCFDPNLFRHKPIPTFLIDSFQPKPVLTYHLTHPFYQVHFGLNRHDQGPWFKSRAEERIIWES
ncbi:hypothetical protein Hdeb2414_s0036g00731321 [Helianthus debilis subsp. tardiflorus]